jgi:cobalt-zinc-cadmium efflux system protein
MAQEYHHDHDHSHGHGHHHPQPTQFNLAFALATLLNLAFTIVEATYALHAHSMGLLADAGHNLGDVLGLLMAWGAMTLLSRRATEKYSYGYKKTTILSALANALLLVFTSAIIIYESINKLIHPTAISETTVMIVALIGILINGSTALLFMRGTETDLNIKATFLHLAYDALISAGVVVAAVIIYYTGWVRLDPLVGIIIVLIILSSTWRLLLHSVDLILGAVPHGINLPAVRDYLSNLEGVTAVHDLHIWGLSTQENALTAHLIMPHHTLADADYQKINHVLKHDFKIEHVTLQIEKGSAENPCGQAVTC